MTDAIVGAKARRDEANAKVLELTAKIKALRDEKMGWERQYFDARVELRDAKVEAKS